MLQGKIAVLELISVKINLNLHLSILNIMVTMTRNFSFLFSENHNTNAYKFSVKSYLTNVFGSLLDEALYFLEKERRNQLRDEATFDITK